MKPTMSSSAIGTAPRFDLARNPPYQINYRAKRAGKRISASKRRIAFRFGFSDAAAIAAGRTGGECRGEEHEVVLLWSHVSGKRHLFLDGREIHASAGGRGNARFEHAWQISGCHILKIVANGTPPAGERAKRERQFDLELDGMSFFDFARIYELGHSAGTGGAGRSGSPRTVVCSGYACDGPACDPSEEEEEVPSLAELKVDLLDSQEPADFLEAQLQPASPAGPVGSVPSLVGASSWSSSSTARTYYDEFAPVEQGRAKTFDSISSEILGAYGDDAHYAPSPAESAPSASRALVPAGEGNVDAVTRAMKSIINLDDITTGPVQPLSKSTQQTRRAVPSWALAGRAPTLAEIRDSQRAAPGGGPVPAEGVMRHAPQQQCQPGALVEYRGAAFGPGAAHSRGVYAAHSDAPFARAY